MTTNHSRMDDNTKGRVQLIALRVLVYAILIFLTILCLFFFYLMIINATRSNAQLATGFTLLPKGNFFVNLKNAWNDASINIPRGMLNSLIIALSSAAITTYFSALTAYGVHVYNFRAKNFVFTFIMAVMMIPSQVSALGFLQLMNKWNLTNNYIPLIVPSIAAPVVFFYMKQYMESTLPLELLEAARIDGAGEIRIFNTIVLPLMVPAMAVQAIFSFVSSWNNYFTPALVLSTDTKKTLPILIAQLRSADFLKFDMGVVYATIAFSIFPVVVVYLALSKFIVGGLAAGSVKG
jgi:multiple sugar transport system permease protein